MSDPFQDYLDQLMGVNPEWVGGASKNAGYAPPDVGSQASQLNYLQDLAMTGMDPLQLWLADQINAGDLQSTFEEDEVIPGVTEGYDTLQRILETSPMSVEGGIAAALLEGKTAEQAIQEAVDAGAIQIPMVDDGTGKQKPDERAVERYRKFAQTSWEKLLGDKPEQRTPGKEILHPFVQRMLDAGFTDPRQQYTPEFVNPSITDFNAEADHDRGRVGGALSAYRQTAQAQPTAAGTPSLDGPGVHGAGARHHAHGQKPQGQSRGRQGSPSVRAQHPAPYQTQSMLDRAKPGALRAYGAAEAKAAKSQKTAVMERAKARAVSDFLAQQGRSPAKDQFTAVLENLRRRGVGA